MKTLGKGRPKGTKDLKPRKRRVLSETHKKNIAKGNTEFWKTHTYILTEK